jgi:VanZ family protein
MPTVFLQRPTAESLARRDPFKRFLMIWLPVLIGIAVIAVESTPLFSASNTSSWLRPVLERIFGPFSNHTWGHLHHLLRKSGHFLGYGTLCVLFMRAWLLTFAGDPALRMGTWRLRSWGLAVASTFAVGCGDEFHQTFLPSRTGMFSDVVLDTCGGILLSGAVLLLGWCLSRVESGRGSKRPEGVVHDLKA